MASISGDMTYQLPRKAFVSLENWVHLWVIDVLFGVFSRGKDMEERVEQDWRYRLRVLFSAMVEQKRVLDCSRLVHIGQNVQIDPTAIIHGPTTIGDNVTIGPGAVIDNCIIGSNVNISQGCQLMLSVVSDGCFLPFRAAIFMTTLMEKTMVAQNTCLQMCVIGRDTFIGAGTTFTDFKVLPGSLKVSANPEQLVKTDMNVLGGCVGHHCRLSSGLIIYPARTIESDVVLLAEGGNQFITRDVRYEDSNHHDLTLTQPYPRVYPRRGE
jgi:carbonic anhydrase/acetyltransferase-like protein (isoleucine patch superfamily)